jgi:hypothetical protein
VVSSASGRFIILTVKFCPPVFRYDSISRLASGSINFISNFPPGIFVPYVPSGVA